MGRKDSLTASLIAANNSIPAPTSDVATLTKMFQNVGLSQKDMVALSGAHTIGKAKCNLSSGSSRQCGTNSNGVVLAQLDELPGLLSISAKFLPTVMGLLKKLADAGQQAAILLPSHFCLFKKNVVAEGTITSTDLDASVHFVKLGANAWKVWVNVAVEPEAFLFRPNSEMQTIKEAVGSTVAWPKDFISVV